MQNHRNTENDKTNWCVMPLTVQLSLLFLALGQKMFVAIASAASLVALILLLLLDLLMEAALSSRTRLIVIVLVLASGRMFGQSIHDN